MSQNSIFIGYCRRDGYEFKSEIQKMGIACEGINKPEKVKFFDGYKMLTGFMKYDDSEFNDNSLEFVLYHISKILGISLAETIRVYESCDFSRPVATISVNVECDGNGKFISFREMRDELFIDLKQKKLAYTPWIRSWSEIRQRKNNINTWEIEACYESDYLNCLLFPFEIAECWCKKHRIKLNDLKEGIINMLVFDILIGQADRSPSNYGLLINLDCKTAALSPLFDNATITKPYVKKSQNSYNQMLLDRNKLMYVASEYFGDDLQKTTEDILKKEKEVLAILKLFDGEMSKDCINLLMKRIKEGMILFGEISK